jgi:uncharacterized protein YbbK (DUF523 family)
MSFSSYRHICKAFQALLNWSFVLGLLLFAMALCPTQGQAAGIALVQHTSKDAGTTTTSSLAFVSPNTAGNWIAVSIRGGLSSSQVFTVVDSNGNTYRQAAQIGFTSSAVTLAIYYAENIKGGANTITVSDTVSGPLRFAILEYSGVATSNSLDVFASATGTSSSPSSGNLTTTASGDLLLGAIATTNPGAFTAGAGYKIEEFVPVEPNTKLAVEDQVQTSAGLASAAVSLSGSDAWGVVLAAFKSAGGTAGVPSTIAATAGTPQSATVNTAFTTQLQATVKDSFNNPVSGVVVTFAAPASGASGTFAGGVSTATTNASGVATAAVFTANSTAGGPYTVTAAVSGVATPANFSLTNVAGAPASVAATAGTPQSAVISTAFATQLQATVKDASSNPVNGITVTFAAPASGPSGTFAGGVNTATTNASGVATAAVFTANSTAGGPYNVTASVSGVSTPANFSLTNLGNPPASVTATAGTPQSATVNTAFTTQLQATVKDASNNPVNGVTVTFAAPASGASGTFAGGVNTATTNASGVATAAIFTANSNAGGPYNVTASVSGVSTPANFSLTNLTGPPASVAATIGTPQSATINTAFATQLQATVKDASNNPVNGITVTFAAPASGPSGTFAGGVNTAMTNASGVATAAVFTANGTAGGPYTVTASVAGVATPANFSLTNRPPNGSITLVQHTSTDAGSTTSASLAFVNPNTAGNWIAVCIRAGSSSSQVFMVTDSNGNTYRSALQLGVTANPITLAIFYAENIKGGANTITVSDAVSSPLRIAILEYSGVATSNSLDVTATAQGTSTLPNSGNVTTTTSGDLLLGEVVTTNPAVFTVGTGYTIEESVPAEPNTKLIAEDQMQASAGVVSASASLGASDNWGAGLAAFKAAGGGGGASPSITSLNPTSGPAGTSVTISGANFGASQGANAVTFNGTAAAVSTWTSTSIAVNVPTGATTGNVVVTVGGVASNGVQFTVTAGPSISTLSLTQGPVGAKITISGASFGSSQGPSTATFNGTAATASSWTDSSIDVTVPTGATTGNVIVTVGSVASNGVPFKVTPPPSIISINPTSGPVGSIVTITGANFGPTVGPISSFVTFNGTQGRSTNWSDTSITIPVPVGATTGNVVVSVGGVVSNGVSFTVTPPPSITSLNPTSGPVGTSVTISGANFGASQGANAVTFNGTAAAVTTWTSTSILATVPSGATPGNVVVTVGGVASNGVTFTVTATMGNIALVQHTSKDAGTTTSASLAFASANTAGNWIAVCIRAGNSSSQVFTVTDSNRNTYRSALQLGVAANPITLAIFYAENIKGGANTITISDTVSGLLRFAILEYSGVATANSVELTASAQGSSATPNSGSANTTSSGDLLLAAIVTTNPGVFTAGTGYTIEESIPAEPGTKLIAEDQLQRAVGSASASASLSAPDVWGAGFAAVRSASGAGLPLSVSISPSTANVPTGYGTQSFTASLVNDFQHQGVMWSLSGAGCNGNACGTLSNATSTSVTYSAPATVPSPAGVTLTATAVADTTKSGTAAIMVTQGAINVAVSPKRAAVTMSASQTVQFTATVTNDPANAGVTWQVDGNNGGNATTGTVSTAGLYAPGTQPGLHAVTAVSVSNASVTASATVAVTDLTGVFTHHNDNSRTGQNLKEYALTTANVNSSTFGALFTCPVDGSVFAAPLYVANLTIGGQTHNVLFVATSHDSVYALDADSPSCTHFWFVSFLSPGVTTVLPADVNDTSNDMFPEIGITSTPVIDPATNTIYVEAKTKDTVSPGCSTTAPCFFHHLHALDILTGAEKFGGPVVISASGFDPRIHFQRPALLLNNGTLYLGFGSHGDRNSYQGWLMGYDATTLARKFVKPLTAAAGSRGGVWQGGTGPALDANGNVYISTGNGNYNGTSDFGDSTVQFSPTGSIVDWFTPFNQSVFNANDIDLGSSGVIILPDSVGSATHPHLALATGKVAMLYLLDQTNMGKFNSSTNHDLQEVTPVPPPNTTQLDGGNFGSPAYWNGNIYTTGVNYPLSQFQISNGTIATPQFAQSSNLFPLRGATPVVSASGTTNGVVWILDLSAWPSNGDAILDAYDATNVSKLLFSSPSSGTGAAGPAVKFTIPTVANGKVYVGGQQTLTVFGLFPN